MTHSSATNLERGRQVAAILAGAWRRNPSPLMVDVETCAAIIPHIIRTGAGALAWWKLRSHASATSAEFGQLCRAYELHKLEAFMQQIRLEQTFERLRRYGVEPLLSKGWSVARLYPEIGLRPYGDLDLLIDPTRAGDAYMALVRSPPTNEWVDLHYGVPELPERPLATIYRRSRLLRVRETLIRTLSAEDQLRQLCLHFARHGGWRPLWLCDIGMFLESLPGEFDWDYFLTGDARRTAWVRAVLNLAVRLLGADRDALPKTIAADQSGWLDPIVLGEWGRCDPGDSHSRDKTPMARYWLRPWHVWQAVCRRIPNALEAAFVRSADPETAPTHSWHRFRFCWSRVHRFAWRLPFLWLSRSASEVTVH